MRVPWLEHVDGVAGIIKRIRALLPESRPDCPSRMGLMASKRRPARQN